VQIQRGSCQYILRLSANLLLLRLPVYDVGYGREGKREKEGWKKRITVLHCIPAAWEGNFSPLRQHNVPSEWKIVVIIVITSNMCYFQQKSYLEDSSVGPTPTVGFVFPHVAFICSLFSVECMQCCEVDGGRGWKGWSNGEVEGGREEWVWEGRREETKYWEGWSSKMMG